MVLSCMTNYDGFVKVKGKMNYAIAIGIRTALERNAGLRSGCKSQSPLMLMS